MYVNDKYEILEDNVRKHYADIVWTHKIQEKEADLLAQKYKRMEILRIATSALTSAGIIGVIFNNSFCVKIITAFLSFATLFVNLFFESFNLKNMIAEHKKTANEIVGIRNEFQVLLMDIRLREKSVDSLENEYKNILEIMKEIYKTAPQTSRKAVKVASKALKNLNENSYSDDEVDAFLPQSLKKGAVIK